MKIRIKSVDCKDLPAHYFHSGRYKQHEVLENFNVGHESLVYAAIFSETLHCYIKVDPSAQYLTPYPAALVDVLDATMPASWVMTHEGNFLHKKLPVHQVVLCPSEWISPCFSLFVDGLLEEKERNLRIFQKPIAQTIQSID